MRTQRIIILFSVIYIVFSQFACNENVLFELIPYNMIPCGNFENVDCISDYWETINHENHYLALDDSIKYEGKFSLHAHTEYGGQWAWLKDSIVVKGGRIYQFSFWYKVKGERYNTQDLEVDIYQERKPIAYFVVRPLYPNLGVGWKEGSFTFSPSIDSKIFIRFRFDNENVWLDNLYLTQK